MTPLIMRSSAFSPVSLTNSSLRLWLDANDSSTVTKDGSNKVSAWADKSSSADNAIQASGTAQPVYSTTSLNSLSGITFDGTDDTIERNVTDYTATNGFTLISIQKFTSATPPVSTAFFSCASGGAGTANSFQVGMNTTATALVASITLADTTAQVVNIKTSAFDTAAVTTLIAGGGLNIMTYLNGTNVVNVAPTSAFNPIFTLYRIARNRGGTIFFPGTLSTIVLYNTRLSDTNRQLVERYLGARYGVTVA